MPTNTRVSALDHAMHTAHTWINDVANTDDREFAYRVLRGWLHTLRDQLPVEASAHFAAQLPDLIRGVFYAGWNPNTVPEKYDAQGYAVRFLGEATISLHDVRKVAAATTAAISHQLPPAHISRRPTSTRPSISSPQTSHPTAARTVTGTLTQNKMPVAEP